MNERRCLSGGLVAAPTAGPSILAPCSFKKGLRMGLARSANLWGGSAILMAPRSRGSRAEVLVAAKEQVPHRQHAITTTQRKLRIAVDDEVFVGLRKARKNRVISRTLNDVKTLDRTFEALHGFWNGWPAHINHG